MNVHRHLEIAVEVGRQLGEAGVVALGVADAQGQPRREQGPGLLDGGGRWAGVRLPLAPDQGIDTLAAQERVDHFRTSAVQQMGAAIRPGVRELEEVAIEKGLRRGRGQEAFKRHSQFRRDAALIFSVLSSGGPDSAATPFPAR